MACTDQGVAVKSPLKGINVKAGNKAADVPRRLVYGRTKVGGTWFFAETTGTTNEYLHLIIGLCDGPIKEIESIYFGNEAVTLDGNGNGTGKWAGAVKITKHLGETNQAADADLVAASSQWTADHRLRGIAYLYVRLDNWDASGLTPSPAIFGAVPDISAVVRGRNDIEDVRNSTVGYTDNAALCFNHYRSISDSLGLDRSFVGSAATVCDQIVSGRKRWTVGGIIEASASADDVTRQFLASMTGTLTATANGLFLRIGAPPLPTRRITWDSLRGTPKVVRESGTGETTTVAAATESTNWTQTDSAGVTDAKKVIKLDLVNSDEQAQQLARTQDAKSGPTEKLTCSVSISMLDVVAGDAVDVDLDPMAYGRFEVVSATVNLELTPSIDMVLERQRSSVYSEVLTTPAVTNSVSVLPRQFALPSITHTGGAPYLVSVVVPPGATARYAIYADVSGAFVPPPLTSSSGLIYSTPLSVPPPTIPGSQVTVVSVILTRIGWASAQGNDYLT